MQPGAPDPNQTDGYLVVKTPGAALAEWRARLEQFGRNASELLAHGEAVRAALPMVAASAYRGIARYPVGRWTKHDAPENQRDALARLRLWELYGEDSSSRWIEPPWFDPDLIPTPQTAREVLGFTDAPAEHEVLWVVRGDATSGPKTIGFDVGYWGSDHFSLIADAMVMPCWHPCSLEALGVLAPWARKLNPHLLFRTAGDASEYRAWYLDQPWAETESPPGQFHVIRVGLVS